MLWVTYQEETPRAYIHKVFRRSGAGLTRGFGQGELCQSHIPVRWGQGKGGNKANDKLLRAGF